MIFLSFRRLALTAGALALPICLADESIELQPATPAPANGGAFASSFPSATPGIPVPMDLKIAESATLAEIHIRLAMRQHEVLVLYSCIIDWPEKPGKATVSSGVPFTYAMPDESSVNFAPIHRLPFSKALSNVQVSVNDTKMEYVIAEGPHPQHDAPSLQSIASARHWLTGKIKLNPGRNVVNFDFSVPCRQTLSGNSGRQAQTAISAGTFEYLLANAGTWGNNLKAADIQVFAEEMLPDYIKLTDPKLPVTLTKTEKGVIEINLLNPNGDGTIPEKIGFRVSPSCLYACNAEDLPDRIDKLKTVLIDGQRKTLDNDYTVTASATLQNSPDGTPCNPENLKTSKGFWAEDISGDGQGETVNLTLASPRKLAGLIIQSGASPMIMGKDDAEALRYPDVAFSMYSRPKTVEISLNDGEYSFRATLRDDWNPQLISVPWFKKSVKNIKVTLDKAYPGTANDYNYMTTLTPVVE